MDASCISCSIKKIVPVSDIRDIDDLFLLALAETVQADYILTGDKDLLSLHSHRQTKIVTYRYFTDMLTG
jgi:predicted nucleic acid-binding protein